MSLHVAGSLRRSLSIVSAALLIHVGSAVAATPENGIQRQVMSFLTGNPAMHAIPRSERPRDEASRSSLDAQEFVQRLLRGWSIFSVEGSMSSQGRGGPAAWRDSRQGSAEHGDVQAMMRQVLLGQHS